MLILLATTLVVCAPGYPGSTAEAQPAMDSFARALAVEAKLAPGSLKAVYDETDAGGVRSLADPDAQLALVTLPFFLEHEQELHLTARLMATPVGAAPLQRWTLVAGRGAPPGLAGYALQSSAGSARFVRAVGPGLAPDAAINSSSAVLSGLRRAASGEKLALLLDGSQAAALDKLPFAAQLQTLGVSAPMPVALIVTVGERIDEPHWAALGGAFARLGTDPAARDALQGVQMSAFVPLDAAALAAARSAYRRRP